MTAVDLQDLLRKEAAGELDAFPPALADGMYRLTITRAVAADTYINVFMSSEDGQHTRVRLMFTGNAASVAAESVTRMGFGPADTPESLHELAPMLVGRVIDAKLTTWQRDADSIAFQNMVPGSVTLVAV